MICISEKKKKVSVGSLLRILTLLSDDARITLYPPDPDRVGGEGLEREATRSDFGIDPDGNLAIYSSYRAERRFSGWMTVRGLRQFIRQNEIDEAALIRLEVQDNSGRWTSALALESFFSAPDNGTSLSIFIPESF